MNKTIKDALAKGKELRVELDKKATQEAKEREEKKRAEAAKKDAELKTEVERCLSCIPEYLAKAVAERKPSFSIMSCEVDNDVRFSALARLIEPEIKKMGLRSKITNSTGWVYTSFDPDTGYDATYFHFEVIVPDEGK